MQTNKNPSYIAVITHKGKQIAQLVGDDRKALENQAHRHASDLNFHRAMVQVRPACTVFTQG